MSDAGWIAIRADGSAEIGTGHVMRCLTLADAFARRGLACVFVCRHLDGSLPEWLRSKGHEVAALSQDGPSPSPAQGVYGGWLGTTQAHDAESTLRALGSRRQRSGDPLLVLIDHYGLDREWEERVAGETGAPIAAIDDLDREHACDFLIDSTYGKDAGRYRGKVPERCVVMVGADYALLRPGFAEIRDETLARRDAAFAAGEPVRNLLIAMGGADVDNAAAWVLEAVSPLATRHDFHTHVVVGAAYPHFEALSKQAAGFAAACTIHRDISDMPALLAEMDLCIGAAGSSSWERCCLGLPTVNIVLADNQRQIAAVLSRAGVVVDGGVIGSAVPSSAPAEWAERHVEPLLRSVDERKTMSDTARAVTDGWGVMRVLSKLVAERVRREPLGLRRAAERDIALVYEWQCFPQTRRYAVNPAVPAWKDHQIWMRHKLIDSGSSFYIACAGGIPAGVVRLDPGTGRLPPAVLDHAGPDAKEVSILTAPEFYGQGVAYRALLVLHERHAHDTIVAHVFPHNSASRALFAKAGFKPYNDEYLVWGRGRSISTE